MATLATRELKIGKIIDKTLGVIERNAGPALIFVVVLTALCVPISYFAVGSTSPLRLAGGELLKAAAGIVCAYFLLVAMMRRTGLYSRTGGDAFLPYIGLSILYALGVMVGVIALVIPGLLVMARWSIAQPLLIGGGFGVTEALGASWDRTRGSEFSIIVAGLALLIPVIAVAIAVSVFLEEGDPVRMVVSQLASSAGTVASLSMGVALYGLIIGGGAAVARPLDGSTIDA